jgi:hypothetical protein
MEHNKMSDFVKRLLGGANERETPMPQEFPVPQGQEPPQPTMPKVQRPKSTIEDAHHKATTLVSAMRSKKTYWEAEIAKATEELRQANVVLEGALLLLDKVEAGMRGPSASAKPAPATAAANDVTFGDLESLIANDLRDIQNGLTSSRS